MMTGAKQVLLIKGKSPLILCLGFLRKIKTLR